MAAVPGEGCGELECPMVNPDPVVGGDAEVYPLLAKANLHRIRGEYPEAKAVCLSILRRLPGNFSAHHLLGDIASEQGESDQAIEWFELALDLQPDNTQVHEKLKKLGDSKANQEAAEAAAMLGVPKTKTKVRAFAIASAVFVVAVGALAFWAGKLTTVGTYNKPIQLGGNPKSEPESPPSALLETNASTAASKPASEPEQAPPVSAVTSSPKPNVDQQTLDKVKPLKEGGRVVDAQKDVRTGMVMLTCTGAKTEDLAAIAVSLGIDALKALEDCPKITIRFTSDGEVIYVSDLARADVDAAGENPENPKSLLKNEWPAATPTG
jgi:hypothetical protein